MWDLGTATLAVAVVAGGALVLPPTARGVGGMCAIIGLLGVMQGANVGADSSLRWGRWPGLSGTGRSRSAMMRGTGHGWRAW